MHTVLGANVQSPKRFEISRPAAAAAGHEQRPRRAPRTHIGPRASSDGSACHRPDPGQPGRLSSRRRARAQRSTSARARPRASPTTHHDLGVVVGAVAPLEHAAVVGRGRGGRGTRRGRRALVPRQRVGRRERGRIGGGVGPGRTRRGRTGATEPDEHQAGEHHERRARRSRRRRAPSASSLDPHRRGRVELGIREQHPDERQIGVRRVRDLDADRRADRRAGLRRRRGPARSTRCAASAAAPGRRSTLAARTASRAACTVAT